MFCHSCQARNNEGNLYCTSCGVQLAPPAPGETLGVQDRTSEWPAPPVFSTTGAHAWRFGGESALRNGWGASTPGGPSMNGSSWAPGDGMSMVPINGVATEFGSSG